MHHRRLGESCWTACSPDVIVEWCNNVQPGIALPAESPNKEHVLQLEHECSPFESIIQMRSLSGALTHGAHDGDQEIQKQQVRDDSEEDK